MSNVADDVMLKLIEGMQKGGCREDETMKLLDGLTVEKVHKPNSKRISIRYKRGRNVS